MRKGGRILEARDTELQILCNEHIRAVVAAVYAYEVRDAERQSIYDRRLSAQTLLTSR